MSLPLKTFLKSPNADTLIMEKLQDMDNAKADKPTLVFDTIEYLINNNELKTSDIDALFKKLKKVFPTENFNVVINNVVKEHNSLTSQQLRKLEKLDNHLRSKYNTALHISEHDEMFYHFDFRKTVMANRKLDKIAQNIKNATTSIEGESRPLSPFEKFMMVYEYVTNYIYQTESSSEDSSISRHWVPIMDGDKIVCVGYASLLRELCNRVFDNEEIKVFNQNITCYERNFYNFIDHHKNNLIQIRDPKYNINGVYYADSCFDSISYPTQDKSFAFCCIPAYDILEYEDIIVNNKGSAALSMYLAQFPNFALINTTTDEEIANEVLKEQVTLNPILLNDYIANKMKSNPSNNNLKEVYTQILNELLHVPPISIQAYINAFTIIGEQKGLKGKELEDFVNKRILNSAIRTQAQFKNAYNDFAKINIEEMKKKLSTNR